MRERTIGIQRLDAWMKRTKTTQEMLADKIGARQQNVSAYLRGRTMPLAVAVAIEKVTKIRVEDFVPAAESGTDVAPAQRAG